MQVINIPEIKNIIKTICLNSEGSLGKRKKKHTHEQEMLVKLEKKNQLKMVNFHHHVKKGNIWVK